MSDRYKKILAEISETREKKNADYGNSFMQYYDEFGALGVYTDIGRKFYRVKQFAKGVSLKVEIETIEDTLLDMALICINAVVWMRERRENAENFREHTQMRRL